MTNRTMPHSDIPRFLKFNASAAIATALALSLPSIAIAQFDFPGQRPQQQSASDVASVRMLADRDSVTVGETFNLVILFDIEPRWHIYWKNPGEGAAAPTVRINAPSGFEVGEIRWPRPKVVSSPVGHLFCYEGRTALFVPVTAPERLAEGLETFTAEIGYAVCDAEKCFFGRSTLRASIQTGSEVDSGLGSRDRSLIDQHRKRLPTLIKDADGAAAELRGSGESRRLVLSGPAHGQSQAMFFPLDSPGVRYGEAEITFAGDQFTAVIDLTINPRNFTSGPPTVGGLVALGSKPDDPSYEAQMPLESESSEN